MVEVPIYMPFEVHRRQLIISDVRESRRAFTRNHTLYVSLAHPKGIQAEPEVGSLYCRFLRYLEVVSR